MNGCVAGADAVEFDPTLTLAALANGLTRCKIVPLPLADLYQSCILQCDPAVSKNAEGDSEWICLAALALSSLEHSG
jgi:hypothetical protein